ncbi:MAG TPA: LytTR family DNA-binding domain-containing protein [Longimicrobiales bacterium]|nr:LytTR family DNA-binding domain-containing protein [Longimicrobiales bacterium]
MTKIRTVLVEDEPLARERLRSLLEEQPDIEIVAEAADGNSAVQVIHDAKPELLFLDVNIPELDGFGVLESLGADTPPVVIFVTAYDQFAVQAFEAHALDYILKPFDEDRFATALRRARESVRRHRTGELDERLQTLIESVGSGRRADRIAVKEGGRIVFLRTAEIDWIGAEGNYARLHVGKRSHLMRETMTSLENRLDSSRFLRIHRSTIVNVDAIAELEPLFQGDYVVILRDGTRLTSSRGYRSNLQEFMSRSV